MSTVRRKKKCYSGNHTVHPIPNQHCLAMRLHTQSWQAQCGPFNHFYTTLKLSRMNAAILEL